jgi:subtilisin family serine protease
MPSEKEYIVTVKKDVNWEEVHNELTTNTAGLETIPDRTVDVVNLRNNNERNTHYALTDEESAALRNDSRIAAVIDPTTRKFKKIAFQEGNFNKTYTASGEQQNWGMLRHLSTTNNYGTSTGDPGGTYDYVLDGTGVDTVIIDSGIQADHPEWQDTNSNSRLQQINWYTASGVSGTQNANHYRDYDGHGTHVTGTVAGKTFGWAKNARIYNIKLEDLVGTGDTGTGIPSYDIFDILLGWHNAKAGSRPTVVNASFGIGIFLNTNVTPNQIVGVNGNPLATITGGVYRGVAHSNTTRSTLISKGLTGLNLSGGYYQYQGYDAATDADLDQSIDSGIICTISSGNGSQKVDVLGGQDYNNYLTLSADIFGDGSYRWYYNRGGSPGFGINPGFYVGALGYTAYSSTLDQKAYFSNGGPGVNIYTAGEAIISAMSTINEGYTGVYTPQNYYLNSSYRQAKVAGTSMASPQMAGMAACLLQAHPTWTPSQVVNWFQNKSQNKMYSSGVDNDYSNVSSIWGGTQRVAYFPLKGQKPFNYTGS